MKFKLKIIEPTQTVFDSEVDFLSIPTPDGTYGILARHENSIFTMSDGDFKIVTDKKETPFFSYGGTVIVEKNEVKIFTEMASSQKDVEKREKEKMAMLEERYAKDINSEVNLQRAGAAIKRYLSQKE